MDVLDREAGHLDAEVGAECDRVGDRTLARVPRGHGHPVHVLRAERVDRDGGDQRRVDPAGEPDHRVGEAVLRDVVAGAEDQCLVDLLLGSEHRSERRRERRQSAPTGRPRSPITASAWVPRPGPRRPVLARGASTSTSSTSSSNWRGRAEQLAVGPRPRGTHRRRRARPGRRPGSRRRSGSRSRRPARRAPPAAPRAGPASRGRR